MLGSIYSLINTINFDTKLLNVDMELAKQIFETMNEIIDKELIESIHDCSDGGLGVCIAEMAIAGDKGIDIDISNISGKNENKSKNENASIIKLFSESASRFIIEIKFENMKNFEKILISKNIPFARLGEVTDSKKLKIKDNKSTLIYSEISDLEKSFKTTLW
jgi:phosphoribosylformylglycinamidine synthase